MKTQSSVWTWTWTLDFNLGFVNKCCEGFYATGGGFGRAFCLYDEWVKEEEEKRK